MNGTGWSRAGVVLAAVACLLAAGSGVRAQAPKYPVGVLGRFTPDGMLIQRVIPDSPADKAGVQAGDLLVKIDGQPIGGQDDFVSVINSSGGSVVVTLRKGGKGPLTRVTLDLLGTRAGVPAAYFLGVTGSFSRDGMRLQTVIPGTPAARVGLEKGDTIVRINGVPVLSQADLFAVLYKSGGTVTLNVAKGNGRLVRLDADLRAYHLGAVGEFTRDGLVVGVVAPATPAAVAGLQQGDLILRIDNQRVRNQDEFKQALKSSGGSVTLLVKRGIAPPVRVPVDLTNNALGAWCEPAGEGLRITTVLPGGPADLIGLQRGDVLLKLDDRRIRSKSDLAGALRDARGLVTLTVRKADTQSLVRLDVDLAR
jgi:S1-C subfamily serine protease